MANRERPRGALGRTVAERIATQIADQRLSYAEVDRRMAAVGRPVGPDAVKRMASGERSIDIDDLAAVAAALGVPIVELHMPPTEVGGWQIELTEDGGRFTYVFDRPEDPTPGWMERAARLMARLAADLGLRGQDAAAIRQWRQMDVDNPEEDDK